MQAHKLLLVSLVSVITLTNAMANTKQSPSVPLDHCYHWLNESSLKYLAYKYSYADSNRGELTFYTSPGTSNGSVAGPGLYCGKTPADSYSYGDRVVRVDFVQDVVMLDESTGKNHCGHRGDFYPDAECQKKAWDIKFYAGGGVGSYAWYVIRNPQAVASWSATSQQLVTDLNANKALEGAAFQAHADNALRAMAIDKSRTGRDLTTNNNARLSIAAILKDPAQLAQIPPLTVIALVYAYKGAEISDKKILSVYDEQMARALTDTRLAYADFQSSVKQSTKIEAAFISNLKKLNLADLSKVNPIVVMQGLDQYSDSMDLKEAQVKKIWRDALFSTSDLASLASTQLRADGIFRAAFDTTLTSKDDILGKIADFNLDSFVSIMDQNVVTSNPEMEAIFKKVLTEQFLKKSSTFMKNFEKLTNAALNKEQVLASIVKTQLTGAKTGLDPLTLGSALDRVSATFTKADEAIYQAKILALPLLLDARPTYQVFDDYDDKKLKLPSFYSEEHFITGILDRAVLERAKSKNPTNIFRLINYGIWTYYTNLIKKASKDSVKVTAIKQTAVQIFTKLSESTKPELAPYNYILYQNASYFGGPYDYKDHPIETAYTKYSTGDASYDAKFEEILKKSYDGSVWQFVLYKDNKAILDKLVDYLLTDESKNELAAPGFLAAEQDKKSWDNIINNRNYSLSGKTNRAGSDICHLTKVVERYEKKFALALTTARMDDLSDWVKAVDSTFCKRK